VTKPLALTTGRRWALVLGLPFVLGAIGFSGLDYVALVGQDSFRVQPITAPIANKVTAGVGNGDITVVPSSEKRAVLSGRINYSLIRPVVKWQRTATGAFLVGPDCFWAGECGAELTLRVPAGEAVHASSGSGNVSASNLTGALELGSGSGNVMLSHLSGPLVLSDGSGNISGTYISASKVQANDSSGNVDLSFDHPPGDVDVSDGSGNINVVVPANVSYSVVANASSGSTNIRVPTNSLSHNVIHLSAASGNISVVPSGP
jgi:hypothetical protein